MPVETPTSISRVSSPALTQDSAKATTETGRLKLSGMRFNSSVAVTKSCGAVCGSRSLAKSSSCLRRLSASSFSTMAPAPFRTSDGMFCGTSLLKASCCSRMSGSTSSRRLFSSCAFHSCGTSPASSPGFRSMMRSMYMSMFSAGRSVKMWKTRMSLILTVSGNFSGMTSRWLRQGKISLWHLWRNAWRTGTLLSET